MFGTKTNNNNTNNNRVFNHYRAGVQLVGAYSTVSIDYLTEHL